MFVVKTPIRSAMIEDFLSKAAASDAPAKGVRAGIEGQSARSLEQQG
jgi:hypothetical protein